MLENMLSGNQLNLVLFCAFLCLPLTAMLVYAQENNLIGVIASLGIIILSCMLWKPNKKNNNKLVIRSSNNA